MPMTRGPGFSGAHAGNSPVSSLATGSALTVPSATTTTVTTYTAVGRRTINRIGVTGDVYARWFIVLNSTTIEEKQTGPDRESDFEWAGGPLLLNSGDILDVKVRHAYAGLTPDFNATIYGI